MDKNSQKQNEASRFRKILKRLLLLIVIWCVGAVIVIVIDGNRTDQRLQQAGRERDIQYQSNHNPSFTGSISKYSNRETCDKHHCHCKVKGSWLRANDYNYCPECSDATKGHSE